MSNELMVQGQSPLTVAEVVAQVQLIQQVMEKVMKKDIHYGVIPGCKKPSLWKPGAEKILSTFNIVADNPIIEDLSSEDEIRYRVTQRGLRMNDGVLVGSASGECSSEEEKYKWRKPVCPAEFDEIPEDRKRIVWKNGGQNGAYQAKQVRTHPKDVANTILKMAIKRALVAMTLVVTAASDIFDQDLEDLPEGMAGEEQEQRPPIQQPKAKEEPKKQPSGDEIITGVDQVTMKSGEKNGKPWTLFTIHAGEKYSTFSETLAREAKRAHESGLTVKLTYTQTEKGRNLNALEVIEG